MRGYCSAPSLDLRRVVRSLDGQCVRPSHDQNDTGRHGDASSAIIDDEISLGAGQNLVRHQTIQSLVGICCC